MAKLNSGIIAGSGVELKSAVVAGANANTTIVVAGMKADAKVFAAVSFAAGVPTDVQADTTVNASGGGVKISVSTSGDQVYLAWTQKAA